MTVLSRKREQEVTGSGRRPTLVSVHLAPTRGCRGSGLGTWKPSLGPGPLHWARRPFHESCGIPSLEKFVRFLCPGKRRYNFQYWRFYLPRQPFKLGFSVSLADYGSIFTQSSCHLLRTFLREIVTSKSFV